MKKLVLKYLLIFNLTLASSLSAAVASSTSVKCAPQLKKCLNAILQIPEGRNLIEAVQKEGPIKIEVKSTTLSKKFGAYWDPDRRIISIDSSSTKNEGAAISSILFELQNASVNSKFQHLNDLASKRKISKDKYVESMEYLEYLNSLNAFKITKKGIKMGVLPVNSQLPIYSSFKEHFKAQKMSGHSDCFAYNYEMCL